MEFKPFFQAAGYLFYLPLIWWGGNRFCKLSLMTIKSSATAADDAKNIKAGRLIGLFERLLITMGVLTFQWELILAVIALKTVARYKELDQQISAEYFMIGSLASLFWSILISLMLIIYDQAFGFQLLNSLFTIFKEIK